MVLRSLFLAGSPVPGSRNLAEELRGNAVGEEGAVEQEVLVQGSIDGDIANVIREAQGQDSVIISIISLLVGGRVGRAIRVLVLIAAVGPEGLRQASSAGQPAIDFGFASTDQGQAGSIPVVSFI